MAAAARAWLSQTPGLEAHGRTAAGSNPPPNPAQGHLLSAPLASCRKVSRKNQPSPAKASGFTQQGRRESRFTTKHLILLNRKTSRLPQLRATRVYSTINSCIWQRPPPSMPLIHRFTSKGPREAGIQGWSGALRAPSPQGCSRSCNLTLIMHSLVRCADGASPVCSKLLFPVHLGPCAQAQGPGWHNSM